MQRKLQLPVLIIFLCAFSVNCLAQIRTNSTLLNQIQSETRVKEDNNFEKAMRLAKEKNWELKMTLPEGGIAMLIGVDVSGAPIYVGTNNNIRAAATIKTTSLWPGGSTGLNLNGSSDNLTGRIGIWEVGGGVKATHVELAGRVIQKDNPASITDHATHVSGTMIGAGINPLAKGMAFGAKRLFAYDSFNAESEMITEASNLLISNHSYGFLAGWKFNEGQNRWEWHGTFDATEDYKFGFYDTRSQLWDSIAYNAPYYLIVHAAGNDRNDNGPAVGETYWRFNASNQMANAGPRPAGISNNSGYDIISTIGTSKNILTVGAVNPISSGYTKPEEVILSGFSSWGPTDDGRIKPDVVANGVSVLSSFSTTDNAYATISGTSMAAPNASGSLLLLQEYWSKLNNGVFMRAATLKGIAIHTADEAGANPGPDYQNGWGLLNMEKAAAVINSTNTNHLVSENNLVNGSTFSIPVVASGRGSLKATISWTDPKGTVDNVNRLNNPAKKLINDLDIRIRKGTTEFQPFILDPANPAGAARPGDNVLDNVEQIVIDDVIPGQSYTIQVTHKGNLERGQQAYSLIVSGVGGQAYCTSTPATNTGARIDSVSLGNFKNASVGGCTTYSDFTNFTANIQANQQVPLTVKVSSCDASSVGKVVKIFADWNNDGDFADANEAIAQSAAINGDAVYTTQITSPAGLQVGYYTIMRVIVQETANAADVQPCGTYPRGETQDYRLRVMSPSNDLGIADVLSPNGTACAGSNKYVSIRIKNFGANPQSNIPVSAVVKNGTTVIATLSAVYSEPIAPFSEVVYTFQTPLTIVAGQTLTITAGTTLATDQSLGNNQLESTVVVTAASAPSGVNAEQCSASQAFLKTNPSAGDLHFWFDSQTANNPVGSGDYISTTNIPANKTFYVQKNGSFKVGPASKMDLGAGGYNAFTSNYIKFTNDVPVVIETAKLYIGNPGKINFILADIISVDQTGFSYRPLANTIVDVYATDPTPQAGLSDGNDPLDTGAVYTLNLPVLTTGEHAIIVQCQNGATIFRNNAVTGNPYPFTVPNVFSIIGNSAALPTDPLNFQRFYYFFYNMQVSTAGCPSPRIPVVASTPASPVITQTGNILSSNVATGIQWYLNGAAIPNATSQTFTATQSGLYKVITTSTLGCILASNEINHVITAVVNVSPTEIKLKASPNPSNGQFFLEFEVKGKEDLVINILNMLGQQVYRSSYPNFSGKFSKQINAGNLSAGVYTLKIQHNKKAYIKKLIVE